MRFTSILLGAILAVMFAATSSSALEITIEPTLTADAIAGNMRNFGGDPINAIVAGVSVGSIVQFKHNNTTFASFGSVCATPGVVTDTDDGRESWVQFFGVGAKVFNFLTACGGYDVASDRGSYVLSATWPTDLLK